MQVSTYASTSRFRSNSSRSENGKGPASRHCFNCRVRLAARYESLTRSSPSRTLVNARNREFNSMVTNEQWELPQSRLSERPVAGGARTATLPPSNLIGFQKGRSPCPFLCRITNGSHTFFFHHGLQPMDSTWLEMAASMTDCSLSIPHPFPHRRTANRRTLRPTWEASSQSGCDGQAEILFKHWLSSKGSPCSPNFCERKQASQGLIDPCGRSTQNYLLNSSTCTAS